MVTAEGTFPKIGNDPVYASELNMFNPKIIGYINVANWTDQSYGTSGTNYQNIGGSLVYPGAGSLQISSYMHSTFDIWVNDSNIPNTYYGRIIISGTAGLNNMIIGTKQINNGGNSTLFNHLITSGALTASGGNVGSPYVFFRQLLSDDGAVYLNNWIITGF